MKEELFNLEVASPEVLRDLLSVQLKNTPPPSRLVNLTISGQQVLVRLFQFGNVAAKNLKNQLLLEAVELLSLPTGEIELSFQILESHDKKISGIYAFLPKKILQEYVSIIDQAKLIPVNLTPYWAACLNCFLKEPQISKGMVCFLDLSKEKIIYLAILSQGQCESLRKIPYETLAEAKGEVVQSLRSACAKSSTKKFDHIYIAGGDQFQNELVNQIKHDFNTAVEHRPAPDVKTNNSAGINVISLNLLQGSAFSFKERRLLAKVLDLMLVALIGVCIFSGFQIRKIDQSIHALKNSYKPADYKYAAGLEAKLKSFNENK